MWRSMRRANRPIQLAERRAIFLVWIVTHD
jgi:hypothetical protein